MSKDDTGIDVRAKASGKATRQIVKLVIAALGAGGLGVGGWQAYEGFAARMEAGMTQAIKNAAPPVETFNTLANDVGEMKGMLLVIRSEASRDREIAQSNHVEARGEILTLKRQTSDLEKIVTELRAAGVTPRTIEKIEERLREVEARLRVLESKVK